MKDQVFKKYCNIFKTIIKSLFIEQLRKISRIYKFWTLLRNAGNLNYYENEYILLYRIDQGCEINYTVLKAYD